MHNFDLSTRTISTIAITLPDDVLSRLEETHEVEVILISRNGSTLPRKLNYRDLRMLLDSGDRRR